MRDELWKRQGWDPTDEDLIHGTEARRDPPKNDEAPMPSRKQVVDRVDRVDRIVRSVKEPLDGHHES